MTVALLEAFDLLVSGRGFSLLPAAAWFALRMHASACWEKRMQGLALNPALCPHPLAMRAGRVESQSADCGELLAAGGVGVQAQLLPQQRPRSRCHADVGSHR